MSSAQSDGTGGRIHLETGHRVVAETVRARIFADPERREAVDVKADDFDGANFYVSVTPEQKEIMTVSLFLPCFAEIHDAVGPSYFTDLFQGLASLSSPMQGYSLTVTVNLDQLPPDHQTREALVAKLSTLKRDVSGAPLWVSFKALLAGSKPPRPYYAIPYRPSETMYIVPSDDLVVVVYAISFENKVEQAIARVFLQEIVISRRQSRDLATAPSVAFTVDPPRELQGMSLPKAPANFIGYVSLAISKRNVEGGRLEKVVGLAQSYRAFLVLHIKATKSQMHTRIRGRSSTWLQVLNRAVPEKLNAEKKTITGRTFKR